MSERRQTFAERWAELAIEDTLAASRATVRHAATAAAGGAESAIPTPPLPGSLPAISLDWPERTRDTTTATEHSHEPDISVGGLLGAGGMGEVRRGHQRSLQREIAIKTLRPGSDPALADGLIREAVLTGYLAHPGVIPVHALGKCEVGQPVLVMKLIEGASWAELLERANHPAWAELEQRSGGDRLLAHLEILSRVCDAVHFAHEHGIIHRDIKPDNVMIGRFGETYLVDWGIAVRMADQADAGLFGTPGFMAPEMVSGATLDARTDVYLLGATLHTVLTGQPRHRGRTIRDTLEAAFDSAPVDYPDHVPWHLAELCNRATAADANLRPASALEFRSSLAEYLRHRASLELSAAAGARLRELEGVHARARTEADGEHLIEATTIVAEARFGFAQALEQWPDNAEANAGLRACLEAQIDVHLRRGDDLAARVLMRTLSEPSPEFEERVRALEAAHEHDRTEKDRLRKLDRELDSEVGRPARRLAIIIMGIGALAAILWVDQQRGGLDALSNAQMVVIGAFFLVSSVAIALVKRSQLLANTFNRRFIGVAIAMFAVLTAQRAIAWGVGIPVHHVLLMDTFCFAGFGVAAGLLLQRWIAWMAVPQVLAALSMLWLPPGPAAISFATASVISVVIGIALWRR